MSNLPPLPPRPPTPIPDPDLDPLLSPELSLRVAVYQNWLSPPDPSTIHWNTHKARQADLFQWLLKGDTYRSWKNSGSLFWIRGKSGAGKTFLTSAIIEDLRPLLEQGSDSLAYFYCEFRDPAKRSVRNAISSLLIQLAAQSDSRREVLQQLYSSSGDGAEQPTDDAILQCLMDVLSRPAKGITYIVIDALDECLSTGTQPLRDAIQLIQALVTLNCNDLRVFATNLPEQDIHNALQPLASHTYSLHETQEHTDDIVNYIKWRIQENSRMRRWRFEDRVSTWEVLSEKAAGSLQWVVCQLKFLPNCLPATVQTVLEWTDPTYDVTYGRVVKRIPNENWEHTHRMIQFLRVSVRPLRVDELSEILTVDYDTGTTPKYEAIWHPETPEADIFTVCRNLVSTYWINGVHHVQFAHVSVPEFFYSDRILWEAVPDRVRRYHSNIEDSHWVAMQTCIAALLHFDDKLPKPLDRESIKIFTMADYAAKHWLHHARYGNVADREDIRLGIQHLFGQESTFAAWVWLHDIDNPGRGTMPTERPEEPAASPMYYAALCGLPGLVKYLAEKYPESVNSKGGMYGTPLHAASAKGHFNVVQDLLESGADPASWDHDHRTPSQVALANGQYIIAQLLAHHRAN
ncbi:hypothetical protein F5148DRAFT_1242678 [Russula earlei]|uniref:Uncharacterized protein n=1 Tax=Russula earlei TaxID=71964 RepID=A0ACC0TX56_9AGAM|nr:hypothetical protein F5148DRAFT_1242678 [Russula earlei]